MADSEKSKNWKKYLIGDWHWSRPFKSLAFIYVTLALIAFFFGAKFVFLPPAPGYDDSLPFLEKFGASDGNDIASVWVEPKGDESPVFLFAHGNAEEIIDYEFLQAAFIQRGWGGLFYDYPGYGLSTGSPDEDSVYAAADAAWKHLTEAKAIAPSRIVLIGRSVGCGPTTYLASKHKVRGVVLFSPFLSAFRTVTRIPLFLGDFFNNQGQLEKSPSPLLIFHGAEDEIIPFAQGKQLFDESQATSKVFIPLPDTGHNDLFFRQLGLILQTLEDWEALKNGPSNKDTL